MTNEKIIMNARLALLDAGLIGTTGRQYEIIDENGDSRFRAAHLRDLAADGLLREEGREGHSEDQDLEMQREDRRAHRQDAAGREGRRKRRAQPDVHEAGLLLRPLPGGEGRRRGSGGQGVKAAKRCRLLAR